MALSAEQRVAVERRLVDRRIDGRADEPLTIRIRRRELAFLLEAIAHFRDQQCAAAGQNPDCGLMYWYETPEGHLERACESFCDRLVEGLIAQVLDHE